MSSEIKGKLWFFCGYIWHPSAWKYVLMVRLQDISKVLPHFSSQGHIEIRNSDGMFHVYSTDMSMLEKLQETALLIVWPACFFSPI